MQAIGAVALVYLAVVTGLQLLVRSVEATGVVYPYREEDWLRYLLPTLWPSDGDPLLLLTGSSTVREDLLVEEFIAAFPGYRIFQGGISAGTLTDVITSLAYVEREYGAAALPKVMVIGFSPRFTAEVPADRPLAKGLDRYSPRFRVREAGPSDFELERKPRIVGAIHHARFLMLKQHERYATVGHWLVARAVSPAVAERLAGSRLMNSALGRMLLPARQRQMGLHAYALERTSPYKYRGASREFGARMLEHIGSPYSYWNEVWKWDPVEDGAAVRARVAQLRAFAARHDIELVVVNLPEGSANRTRYEAGHPDAYLSLLHTAFDTVPLLNLRCLLDDDAFVDAEHARPKGAQRVTERVIGFMQDVRVARVSGAATADIAARYAAESCPESGEGTWAN